MTAFKSIRTYRLGMMSLLIIGLCFLHACQETEVYIEPEAGFEVSATEVAVLEQVLVTNQGKGERFSFWPGDKEHDYSKKDQGNYGLIPTLGNDFEYYYKQTGTYTMVMVASSYNELTGQYSEAVDSVRIHVSTGSDGLNFSRIEINTVRSGYKPRGIIRNDSIYFHITNINRAEPGLDDKTFVELINRRSLLFTMEGGEDILVYDENDLLLAGNGTDPPIAYFDTASLEPIQHRYRVQDPSGEEKTFISSTLFYPELFDFSLEGISALRYSEDGLKAPEEDEMIRLYMDRPDSLYLGILVISDGQDFTRMVPEFSVTEGAVVTLEGVEGEQISGESEVDLTQSPLIYTITRDYSGFKVRTKFAINTYIF